MARSSTPHVPLIAVLLLASAPVAAAVGAQGLGELATRTERDRGDRRATVTLSDRDLAASAPWPLTPSSLSLYASIRADLSDLRRARPALHARLYDASRNVSHLIELAPVLADEPMIAGVLERYHVTAVEYLRMDQAVLTAIRWSWRDTTPALQRQLAHMANIRFVREQARLVREETSRYRGEQWYDEERFVEQF